MIDTEQYFKNLKRDVDRVYVMANEARAKGLDPVDKVEIPLAMSMAEKVVGLISTIYPQMEGTGIDTRILDLEKEYGKLDTAVCFKIAEEIAKQKYCKFASLMEAIDAGIRIGLAYITLGVVSSPIEGYTGLKLGKTREGKEYFIANFSGPIRSAGTTASCVVLMLIDYLREMFGYAKYDPTEEEIKRVATELTDFHERITNLQYMPTEQEMLFLAKNMPFQVAGDASEKLEVSNYKNLERVDTNFLRSGFCLIMAEGLAQKAAKGYRLLGTVKARGFKSTGFDFLEEYIKLHEKRDKGKTDDSPTYIKDLVAGRPVFGHPSRSGSFRFRYGRGRNSGFSAFALHPATLEITDRFIAIGTQLKIEKPTKGAAITTCDQIEGPIVKLFNGSVKKLSDPKEAKKLYPDVEEIIYMGDMLFPFSDLNNRNAKLIKPGFVEEWWSLELREKNLELEKNLDKFNVPFDEAVRISLEEGVPLYPKFIFYWTQINKDLFLGLIDWLKNSIVNGKVIFPYTRSDQEKFELGKRALELLGIEHEVTLENVVLDKKNSKAFLCNLGLDPGLVDKHQEFFLKSFLEEKKFDFGLEGEEKGVLEVINSLCKFIIKDKAGAFVGSRMGRPEKAKLRKLQGSPNVLFPVGQQGGRLRSVQAACEDGKVRSAFPLLYCDKCKKETIYSLCEVCGEKAKKMFYCPECREKTFNACKEHERCQTFCNMDLDINHYYTEAVKQLGFKKEEIPILIKGVRGMSSAGHMMENLSKGFLRAKHDLQVNKDGTIRFDATELPLVAFKPKELFVSIERLRELGYTEDIDGNDLVNGEQILELMPHDVLLPSCFDSPDEGADKVFMKISGFLDDLLVRFYGLNSFYDIKKREDLIGAIGVCMAPHNCAGVICRFIGFSNTQGLLASPYMHAAIRRDCDGDEAALMLLGDVLLNFSRKYLPSHRGGTQDAPLVLNAKIDAGEVDDQILDFEFVREYPLELYHLAEQAKHSSEVKSIRDVKQILAEGGNPFIGTGFTHDTSDINYGVSCSSYKLLPTMKDKVKHQMELVEKIRAVDTSDIARLIIDRHFMRDMKGNLRNFPTQGFRCVSCNEIARRPPLTGVCPRCRGKLIFTVHEGGIKKYLEPALELAKKYNLSSYIQQNLELVKRYIDSIFGRELEKQTGLTDYFE